MATTKRATIESTINLDNPNNGKLVLQFSNGQRIIVAMSDLTPGIATQALMHGLKQKLVDAAAISRNTDTGRAASVEDKFAAVNEVYQRLITGQWNAPREGGGNTGGQLFQALCRIHTTKTPEAIRAWLDGKTDAEKLALRKNAKVAEVIAAIIAEKAKDSGIDTDSMLDELNDE